MGNISSVSATNVVDSHIALMNEIVNTTTNECIIDNSNLVVFNVSTCPDYQGDIVVDFDVTQRIQVSNKCIFDGSTSTCLENNIKTLVDQTADAATSGFGGVAWISGLQASDTRAANYAYLTAELTNSVINAYNNKCFFPSSNEVLVNVDRTGAGTSGGKSACNVSAPIPGCEVNEDGSLRDPDACRAAQVKGENEDKYYVMPNPKPGNTIIKPTIEQTINAINECVVRQVTQTSAYTAMTQQVQQEATASKAGLLTPALIVAIVICLIVGLLFFYTAKKKGGAKPVALAPPPPYPGQPPPPAGAGLAGLAGQALKAVTDNPDLVSKAFKAFSATTGDASSPPVVGLSKGAKGALFAVISVIVLVVAVVVPLFISNNSQAVAPTYDSLDAQECPPSNPPPATA
jgi:hypothetical protein